jgi:hypothetical protein
VTTDSPVIADSGNDISVSPNLAPNTIEPSEVPGLVLIPDYITLEEEQLLLEQFTRNATDTLDTSWHRVQDRFVVGSWCRCW